jgi:hypothetical protein
MRKKLLLASLFAGALLTSNSYSAEVGPSQCSGGYGILEECVPNTQTTETPTQSPQHQVKQQVAKPAVNPQTTKIQSQPSNNNTNQICAPIEEEKVNQPSQVVPVPVKQPEKVIISKEEKIIHDWGDYKKLPPEQLLESIQTILQTAPLNARPPENAPVGCCYGMLVKPPTYKEVIIKYIKKVDVKVQAQQAQFKTVEKKIVIRPAYHKIEVIPPKYEVKEEKIQVVPPRVIWQENNGIFCKVEVPAEYITIKRQVMVEPPKCVKKLVPAEYITVKVKKLVKDASCTPPQVKQEIQTATKKILIKGPEIVFDAILCNVNFRPEDVKKVQEKLKELGYYNGPINGKLDEATMAALVKFQVDHNLPAGNLSIETLEALGLHEIAQNYTKCEVKNLQPQK